LGLSTLGAFAALPADAVLARFGPRGAWAHRLAAGGAEHAVAPAPPPPDLEEHVVLDPPATRVDEAAFAAKALADRLLDHLAARGLSCTQVVVEAETEHGERLTRSWRHEGTLTAAALVTRVRWQLDGWLAGDGPVGGTPDDGCEPTGGLTLLRLVPEQVVPAEGRQLGFWGGDAAAHDRADRVLARLQGMLGHDAVVTARPAGGRTPAERVRWVPWGDAADAGDASDVANAADPSGAAPWPGAVPGPAPARVHDPGLPAELLDDAGRPVAVTGRGEAVAPPARLRCAGLPGGGGPVRAWAGPWCHDVRWWDRAARRRRALWHVVVQTGPAPGDEVACLVGIEQGRAVVEAVHD
ncbi:MAG: DNA polymerase Y family protein, partial [Actinomycetes bacterium]